MATYGKLEAFNSDNGELWVEYIERMEFYFAANDIDDSSVTRLGGPTQV